MAGIEYSEHGIDMGFSGIVPPFVALYRRHVFEYAVEKLFEAHLLTKQPQVGQEHMEWHVD